MFLKESPLGMLWHQGLGVELADLAFFIVCVLNAIVVLVLPKVCH